MTKAVCMTVSEEKCANAMCPVGSMKYGCDCLLYVHHDLEWKRAVAYCAQMNGKLVNVRSKGMQKHIKTFLKAQLGKNSVPNELFCAVSF